MEPPAATESTPAAIRQEAVTAAQRFSLPFSRRTWQGTQGNWTGMGTGSSIDFQDCRAYQWGDDPRGIHWTAYARTEQLTMKVFRAELAPVAQIVVDVSESMFINKARAGRTEALLLFCLLSATRSGAQTRVHAVKGRRSIPLEAKEIHSGLWLRRISNLPADETMPSPDVWRTNGMNILISDLLYPGEPGSLLAPMASRGGLSLILAPTLHEEAAMPGTGNARLKNCESGLIRNQRISDSLARRYAQAYAAHFSLWSADCRRYQTMLACIPCIRTLAETLAGSPLAQGAVELA